MSDLLERRLLFVTGKGGVGKTTVAAALGQLAAEGGKRALVCEMEPRGDLSSAFECGPTTYSPRAVSPGLFAMSMDTEAALREYLQINVHLPVFGRLTAIAQAFDFVASAAPGVREILTVGKLCYEVRERHYDLVIADATASGTIVGQLSAPLGINELVRRGAIDEQTRWMLDILEDPERTGVVVVATPEEMPVTEGLELIGRLSSETSVQLATVVANRVLPELFGRGEETTFAALDAAHSSLANALGESEPVVADLLDAARLAVRLRRVGAEHLDRLRQGLPHGIPLLLVPFLFGRARSSRHSPGRRGTCRRARAVTRPESSGSLERLLATKEIVVACGPGGVGKTTTAAGLAAAAAVSGGGRVLVLTVDPARRLAEALALSTIGNEATRIPNEAFTALGIQPRGELWAAMLDTKESWDGLVRRHASDQRSARAILSNPLYRTITGRFAASNEYIAMERLYELHAEGRYDLLVVDTPPSLGALDFVDAPEKMAEFFSSRLLRWLTVPLRSRVLGLAARPFTEVGDRVLGTQFLADIGAFFLLLEDMHEGFADRARQVRALLRAEQTTFMVVTTAETVPVREAERFAAALERRSLHLGLLVANRVLPQVFLEPAAVRAAEAMTRRAEQLAGELSEAVGGAGGVDQLRLVLGEVGRSFSNFHLVATRQAELLDQLLASHADTVTVPQLTSDVVDLGGLVEIGTRLYRGLGAAGG